MANLIKRGVPLHKIRTATYGVPGALDYEHGRLVARALGVGPVAIDASRGAPTVGDLEAVAAVRPNPGWLIGAHFNRVIRTRFGPDVVYWSGVAAGPHLAALHRGRGRLVVVGRGGGGLAGDRAARGPGRGAVRHEPTQGQAVRVAAALAEGPGTSSIATPPASETSASPSPTSRPPFAPPHPVLQASASALVSRRKPVLSAFLDRRASRVTAGWVPGLKR